jgi:hypothetical protein
MMDQTEINSRLQKAKEYQAENYLAKAAKLLSRNKNIKVEMETCE